MLFCGGPLDHWDVHELAREMRGVRGVGGRRDAGAKRSARRI
jgi:hypothetical protein